MRRGALWFTDAEWAAIVRAAEGAGLRPTAWVQQVAHETAAGRAGLGRDETVVLVAELRESRAALARAGAAVRGLARADAGPGERVLALVAGTVHRLDAVLLRVHRRLAG